MENGLEKVSTKCSTGLDQGISVLLAYLFGWISGLIFFLIEKENQFVRFHAMQSILLSAAWFVIMVALWICAAVPILGFLFSMAIIPLTNLGMLAVVVICIIKAYGGVWFKLPVIGDLAQKYAGEHPA